jgi:uncharacterized protein YbaP (TraB family)
MRRIAALFAVLLVPLLALAGAAWAAPPVWIVRDADSEIVLFGSLHLLPAGVDWKPAALTRALGEADDLWFELPLDSAATAEIQQRALARSHLPAGQTLSALLSRTGRKRLARICKQVGVPLGAVNRMQPWYAETALGVAVYRQQGAIAEEGVERQIIAAAPPGAELKAFETGGQQIDMFSQGSQADQLRSLEDSLRELETDPGFVPRLVKMWTSADVRGLDKQVIDKMRRADPAQYRRLLVDRNHAWLPLIEGRLAGSGHTVMVVGVGHLIGKDGIPALLRARGFRVEGP